MAYIVACHASHADGLPWPTKLHPTHKLVLTGPVLWCQVCGHHASSAHVIKLRQPCDGEPPEGSTYATRLKHLGEGRHPVSKQSLRERPVPIDRGRSERLECAQPKMAARI